MIGSGSSTSMRATNYEREIAKPSQCVNNNTPSLREIETKPKKIRSLTIEETLTLQGFDPKYNMTQARTQKNRWTMIGNAVVPAVAKAIIGGIKQ
jgi:site-specific DNA-cytosine methylase